MKLRWRIFVFLLRKKWERVRMWYLRTTLTRWDLHDKLNREFKEQGKGSWHKMKSDSDSFLRRFPQYKHTPMYTFLEQDVYKRIREQD